MKLINKVIPLVLAGVIIAFGYGFFKLFDVAFEKGDMYPPYSSLNSEPVGGKALFEAMKQIENISVSQNLNSLMRLPDGKDTTLLICGGNLSDDPEDLVRALENFAAAGGRLVITFLPVSDSFIMREEESGSCGESADAKESSSKECSKGKCKNKDDGAEGADKQEKKAEEDPWAMKFVSIEERWDFLFSALRPKKLKPQDVVEISAEKQDGSSELPESISWHSTLYFDKLAAPWKALYAWEGHAVIIERPWIRGSIVLCSDSYFLSNEAMRRDRHSALIAWLIGPSTSVIFDENHFGIEQRQGVMTLVRKYRLDQSLVVLGLLAALFIWKNAFSLTPKSLSVVERNHQGKDSTAGLVNLLRRSIPPKKIFQVCFDEWERSHDLIHAGRREKVKEIIGREMALPPRQRDAVRAYSTISALLNERDGKSEN
jgi:hypothetical protein